MNCCEDSVAITATSELYSGQAGGVNSDGELDFIDTPPKYVVMVGAPGVKLIDQMWRGCDTAGEVAAVIEAAVKAGEVSSITVIDRERNTYLTDDQLVELVREGAR